MSMENPYIFDHAISPERENYLTDRLIAFNQRYTTAHPLPIVEPQLLQISLFDRAGNLLGGLVGRTHNIPQWLETTIIWVDESRRGQGLGRQLMAEAERTALQRGCYYARAITSDFQAPNFYRKLGYSLYGRLENCPPGEIVFYFWKELGEVEV